jgi:hypothetical protein
MEYQSSGARSSLQTGFDQLGFGYAFVLTPNTRIIAVIGLNSCDDTVFQMCLEYALAVGAAIAETTCVDRRLTVAARVCISQHD